MNPDYHPYSCQFTFLGIWLPLGVSQFTRQSLCRLRKASISGGGFWCFPSKRPSQWSQSRWEFSIFQCQKFWGCFSWCQHMLLLVSKIAHLAWSKHNKFRYLITKTTYISELTHKSGSFKTCMTNSFEFFWRFLVRPAKFVIAIILFNPMKWNSLVKNSIKLLTLFIEVVDIDIRDHKLALLSDVVLVDLGNFHWHHDGLGWCFKTNELLVTM